jgi:hypothetical protein
VPEVPEYGTKAGAGRPSQVGFIDDQIHQAARVPARLIHQGCDPIRVEVI